MKWGRVRCGGVWWSKVRWGRVWRGGVRWGGVADIKRKESVRVARKKAESDDRRHFN